ncbi:MAG: acyl-[ACP]--phospholipid O-acyltransferase [Alphaproteobacteria bacterium]|nr:acyl-[ACP]--phospholipid O-acyltransferase [Alphaproteobacteria bacterium]
MKLLFQNKTFGAFFWTQFLGAFNDNFFRSAFVTLITFHLLGYSESARALFVSAAFGLFMAPAFAFSPLAGQLADRFDKTRVIRWIKVSEVLIVGVSAFGFMTANPFFLLVTLFFMGAHAAFFGPVKYSILPDILSKADILRGNGYIEAGTFLAIMLGTLSGTLMVHLKIPPLFLSTQLLIIALLGLFSSWRIPLLSPLAPHLKIQLSWFKEVKRLSYFTRKDHHIYWSIICISWFWLVGTILLSELPPFAKAVIQVDESVFILLLLLFTVGIGMGSLLCNSIFKGKITTKAVPLLSLGMIPLLVDISSFTTPLGSTPLSLLSYLFSFQGLRLTFDILALSFVGGLFIVPLYAFLQTHVPPSQRSQIIAYNSIVNAGFMVFASGASFMLLSFSFSIPTLIFFTALGQLVITFYAIRILPDIFLKDLLLKILTILFRFEIHGLENYQKAGKRVILVANHTSYLDALLVAAALPEKPLFAINLFTAQKWWVKPFLILAKVFPIDPLHPYGLREVIEEAKKGHKVIIFPEGRLTLTGSLMKIYEGPGMVAERAEATLLPIRIEGAQYTFFSLLKGQFPRHFFPKITLTLLPPQTLKVPPDIKGRKRRHVLSEALYDIMTTMMFTTSSYEKTLFSSLIEASKTYGGRTPILKDTSHKSMSYRKLLLKSFTLGRFMNRKAPGVEPIGLLLPNTHGLIISFWALHSQGRIPAMLNYASGSTALLTACKIANIKHIYTAREFIEKAHLEEGIALLKEAKIHIHFLEIEAKKIPFSDKISGFLGMLFPHQLYKNLTQPSDTAVILFTSGSEGIPKGVVLSHANIQANRYQLASVVDFNSKDYVLNILPLFHAFGLTAGMLLPLLSGIRAFHYISPLHYRIVAELIYDKNATILFGTDTFLNGYGRVAHVYDFHTLRYVFAGAEKLKPETQNLWFDKFGLRIFEGYGTTETSPVIAVNTAMHFKAGTVGRFLPGIEHRLEAVEGIETGGRLWVKGPNVMKGYLLASSAEKQNSPPGNWYDTGDIATVDQEGYVHLLGRAKRFAKVGGEMISLSFVEEAVNQLWPEHHHAVLTKPHPIKGEQLVLFTTYVSADRSALISFWKAHGYAELSLPRIIHIISSLPRLGSGKVDYRALEPKA